MEEESGRIKLENGWTLEPLKSGYILRNGPGTVMNSISKILGIYESYIEYIDPGDGVMYRQALSCEGKHTIDENRINEMLARKEPFSNCFSFSCIYCKEYLGWYCPSPNSPNHVCHYDNKKDPMWDSCIYCGQPDERR